MSSNETNNSLALTDVITTALKLPGVKVDRSTFLRDQFKKATPAEIQHIIDVGPIEAKCSQKELEKLAGKLITERTLVSTGASFAAGLPGGLAMAATIPADMLQFYGVALRLAQELAYLYGEPDLWKGEAPDSEKVTNQLILYCGVMLGASGAASAVRVMSSALAKQIAKKLPQQALTKQLYYRVIRSVLKFFGVKITKDTFAKGVSKAVPILGGVVSGGITFATLRPMGQRLAKTLDEAHFDYTQEEYEQDMQQIIVEFNEDEATPEEDPVPAAAAEEDSTAAAMKKIQQAKQMLDSGIITEEEFAAIKARIISEI